MIISKAIEKEKRKVVNVIEETREQQDRRMAWWREARFGMFIHWGIGAVTAGMRKGMVWYGGQSFGPGDHWAQRARTPIKEDEQISRIDQARNQVLSPTSS